VPGSAAGAAGGSGGGSGGAPGGAPAGTAPPGSREAVAAQAHAAAAQLPAAAMFGAAYLDDYEDSSGGCGGCRACRCFQFFCACAVCMGHPASLLPTAPRQSLWLRRCARRLTEPGLLCAWWHACRRRLPGR
jgi:hypothetical protein